MTLSKKSILLAIDTSPQSLAALDIAATLASRLDAELRGMYVEDIDLLRTAELPFACAISASGHFALTPQLMERQLRRQADIARSAVEAAGIRSRIAWSFSVARGEVFNEIVRAASTAELVTVGRSGWSAQGRGRLGSVTRSLIRTGTTSLLMVGQRGVGEKLVVLYDGSPASDRALALAVALNGRRSHPITVLVVPGEPDARSRAADRLQQTQSEAQFETFSGNPAVLVGGPSQSASKTVLIPATVLASHPGWTDVLEENNLSIFLVR